ncbi:MAG TPA: hypothetical protein VGA67_03035 [Candidatus Dojkabacteria bacterium]|jgi:hypothetical protein
MAEVRELNTKLSPYINSDLPITIGGSDQTLQGDRLISRSAVANALSEVSTALSTDPLTPDIINSRVRIVGGQLDLNADISPMSGRRDTIYRYEPNRYYGLVKWVMNAFKITPSNELLQSVPTPLPANEKSSAMYGYDPEKVVQLSEEIIDQLGVQREDIVVIIEGGSNDEKRVTPAQAVELADLAIEKGKYPIIVSDRKVTGQEIPEEYMDLPYAVLPKDINRFAAYFRISNTIFTTDSFLYHLAAQTIAQRNMEEYGTKLGFLSPFQINTLFTVGVPEAWNYYNVNCITSMEEHLRQKNMDTGLITPTQYKKSQGMRNDESGISVKDFNLMKTEMNKVLV